jgi:hypothetical protein
MQLALFDDEKVHSFSLFSSFLIFRKNQIFPPKHYFHLLLHLLMTFSPPSSIHVEE